ncbi:MAG: 30S ribosomal protein S4e [Candidatus Methanomethylicia archaeon]|nr:30S ribosomal protein S4e [Candidatus Methanomethylicia archaeon]
MTRHLTTYEAPRFWPIRIKDHAFTIRPSAGPHPLRESIPLGVVLRDVLKVVKTVAEAKRVLAEGRILVDGKVRVDHKLPVGLMDVIYLKSSDSYYRVVPDKINKLALTKITAEEASFKLVRIQGKRTLKNKSVQLNTHDGRSITLKVDDPFNIQLGYRPFDALKISLPDGQILESIPMEADTYVAVIGGTNIGSYGVLSESIPNRDPEKPAKVIIGDAMVTVILKYLFPIGKGSPIINISGTGEVA